LLAWDGDGWMDEWVDEWMSGRMGERRVSGAVMGVGD
jgi:hypothetical protein